MKLLLSLTALFVPSASANAPSVNAVIELVAGPIGSLNGIPNEFGGIAQFVAHSFLPLLNVIAVLVIVISGILAIIAQDENRILATRKVVTGALSAIVLINASAAIAKAVIAEFNYYDGGGPGGGIDMLSEEIFGLLGWIEVPVLLLALLTIVISGIRTLASFGGDQGLDNLKKTVLSVIFGIVLIVVKFVVSDVVVVERTATALNQIGINLTVNLLIYLGLAAVIMIVIAGIYMIANVGNDEQFTKAKNLVIRVVVGLIVIVMAAALVALIGEALLGA